MKISQSAKNAICLGSLCSVAYFAVYIARNILSAVTPQMVADGFTEDYIGSVSALYLLFYAFGQLINGAIGDKIKAKYMLSFGLFFAGVTNLLLPVIIEKPNAAMIVYGMTGFFLSMIYGPMTKVVSENTEPIYATRCSLGYTFSSLLGSPAAGILAIFLSWQSVFYVSTGVLVLMAASVFTCFTVFEKKGLVRYCQYKPKEKGAGNLKILFERQIVKFSLISILTGVIRTSVVFWLPTYFAQYHGFEAEVAASIFTGTTLVISMTSFIAVFIYEKLGHNMDKTILIGFSASVIFFTLTYFIKTPVINIIFIVIAIMCSNMAATMLWSRYCPSLRDTGLVSSATGFLDFLSYSASSIANRAFAAAITAIGWRNLILVWIGIVLLGVIVALPYKRTKRGTKDV
ncbi:MAG: MFS transporter [Clostridia bacterium]|nr:MFS transporter [Clostridia bacterium]